MGAKNLTFWLARAAVGRAVSFQSGVKSDHFRRTGLKGQFVTNSKDFVAMQTNMSPSLGEKLVIGTASWGNRYGMFNDISLNSFEAKNILRTALPRGITAIDTAPSYGDSELVLGSCDLAQFRVHTKVDVDTWSKGPEFAYEELLISFKRLGVESVEGLTFHSAESFLRDPQRAINFLLRIKSEGLAKTWGVSVYEPSQALEIIRLQSPDYIQAPASVLDRRFLETSFICQINEAKVRLQARSIFLQGLLLQDVGNLPIQFKEWEHFLLRYASIAKELGISRFQLSLLPIVQEPAIDCVVIGINEKAHLLELMDALGSDAEIPLLNSIESSNDLSLIDPRRWKS
jgi:aryl-alcohol dehydrogenase-like predicted oxidoreductase